MSITTKFNIRYYNDLPYVNLTKICHAEGRELSVFLRSKKYKEFMEVLIKSLNMSREDLIIIRTGGIPTQQGTYAHPYIALHMMLWLSPKHVIEVLNCLGDGFIDLLRKQEVTP